MLKRFFSVFIALLLVFNVSSTSFVMTASASSATASAAIPLVQQALTAEEIAAALSALPISTLTSCFWLAAIPAGAYLAFYGIAADIEYTAETLNVLGSYTMNKYNELAYDTQIYLSSVVAYVSANVDVVVEEVDVYLSKGILYGLNGIMNDIVGEGVILSNTALTTQNNCPTYVLATMPTDTYNTFSTGTSFWFSAPDFYESSETFTSYYYSMTPLYTYTGYPADYCVYSTTDETFALFSSVDNTMVSFISYDTALQVRYRIYTGIVSWTTTSFGFNVLDIADYGGSIEGVFSNYLSGNISLLNTTLPLSTSSTLDDFLSTAVPSTIAYPLALDIAGALDYPWGLTDDDTLVAPMDVVDVFTGTKTITDVFADTAISPDDNDPDPESNPDEPVLPTYIDISVVWHYVVDMLLLAFPFISLFTVVVSYIPEDIMIVIWGSLILAVLFGYIKRLLQ